MLSLPYRVSIFHGGVCGGSLTSTEPNASACNEDVTVTRAHPHKKTPSRLRKGPLKCKDSHFKKKPVQSRGRAVAQSVLLSKLHRSYIYLYEEEIIDLDPPMHPSPPPPFQQPPHK
ncbi:hypothetical protein EJ110_NYTH56276 [Nymphaea thermarum]|nr:hypothetical protein EJ110_NYTH56276 [Nymphaea thermarum]